MPKARGQTGTVRGLSSAAAGRHMLAAIEYVRKEHGGVFSRALVRDFLMEERKLTRNKAEGVAFALTWPSSVAQKVSTGTFRLLDNAEELARHRGWRFSMRLGLPEAQQLFAALGEQRKLEKLTPALEEIYQRGLKAMRHLKK